MEHDQLKSLVRAAIELAGDVEGKTDPDSPEVIGLVAGALVAAALKDVPGNKVYNALFPKIPRS